MNTTHADRILKTSHALRTSLMAMLRHVDELTDLIEAFPLTPSASLPAITANAGGPLRLDRSTYSVVWNERSCSLGLTMAFRVLERLARRPNEYVSTDRLLEELWAATRTPSTVRSTVCALKAKLRAAGMQDLSNLIDGSNPGHYGLMLQRR